MDDQKTLEKRLQNLEERYGDRIPAEEVPRWLGMSRMQFVDMMNTGKGPFSSLEEFFREHDKAKGPFFRTRFFDDYPHVDGYGGTDPWTFEPVDLRTWLKGDRQKGADLAQENEALKREIKRLREAPASDRPRYATAAQAAAAFPSAIRNACENPIIAAYMQEQQEQERRLKESFPRFGVLNQVEKERDRALKRVAELERQLDGEALAQDREALEKTRKELEAERIAHAETRKELEEKIGRLEQQLAEKNTTPPSPIGGQSEDLAQALARVAELEEELDAEKRWAKTLEDERDQKDLLYWQRSTALKKRLAEKERENQGLRLQLAEKSEAQGVDSEQAEVMREEELEDTRAKLQDALEGHGLCSLVIRERQAGKTDQEIDSELERLKVERDIHRATLLYKGGGAADERARKKAYERLYEKEPVTTL